MLYTIDTLMMISLLSECLSVGPIVVNKNNEE